MRLFPKTKACFSLLFLHLITFILIFPQLNQVHADLPFGLDEGDYAQYAQEFSTGETHQLRWEITYVSSLTAEIQIISHGIRFNYTSMTYSIIPGGGIMTISLSNWEIQQFCYLNGTAMPEQPIGYKVPFWIPTPITETTRVNTLYDENVTPSLVGPLEFNCLPTPRMCWKTDNRYSANVRMQRFYDATTGIVLRIQSSVQVFSNSISIEETLNDTNISILQQIPATTPPLMIIGVGITGFTLIAVIIFFVWMRRRKQ